uniref:Methyltransferase FkbM domain-containing protein n=1 Tax=Acrobeloides nanus TaxID=290746 RepID=A0A914E1V9_9BILA
MGRYDEKKKFLPLAKNFSQEECKWLTIGIGGDTLVEKQFKQKYPKCQLYGVEPSPSQFIDFDKYGTVIPYGVGIEASTIPLIIRDDTNSYVTKNVSVIPLEKLLDRFLHTRTVHYMTIDIEGFEYSILNELLPGKAFAKQNVTFCQIDAELHSDIINDKNVVVNLQQFLKKFTDYPSPYLPIFTTPFLAHEKVTFINVESEECEKAFNFKKFL